MLERIIEKLLLNGRKYIGTLLGLIIGVLCVTYGVKDTFFIVLLMIIGYNLGDKEKVQKLKKEIRKRIAD